MPYPNAAITEQDPVAAVREWFAILSDCCARIDYASASAIFAHDVASFGTRADIVTGLDLLQKYQWERIWPNIANFKIDMTSVRGGGHENIAWGITLWTSTGFHESGETFDRPGRGTVILERRPLPVSQESGWLAVHTHFSLHPGTPPRTHGRKA